jgi:hypothetical protein
MRLWLRVHGYTRTVVPVWERRREPRHQRRRVNQALSSDSFQLCDYGDSRSSQAPLQAPAQAPSVSPSAPPSASPSASPSQALLHCLRTADRAESLGESQAESTRAHNESVRAAEDEYLRKSSASSALASPRRLTGSTTGMSPYTSPPPERARSPPSVSLTMKEAEAEAKLASGVEARRATHTQQAEAAAAAAAAQVCTPARVSKQ